VAVHEEPTEATAACSSINSRRLRPQAALEPDMKICLYTETALPELGGQALAVDALARQLIALGHQPVVVAPRKRQSAGQEHPRTPYPLVYHPRVYSTRWFVHCYGLWLARLHRVWNFDVVHCHSTYPNGYVAAVCKELKGVPLVITSHGSDVDALSLLSRKPQLLPRYVQALRSAQAVVALSSAGARLLHQIDSSARIIQIPNGVDARALAAPQPRPETLPPAIQPNQYMLFLGRLVERKGADLVVAALAATAAEHKLMLVVAGQGPQEQSLRKLAGQAGVAERVFFVGRVEGQPKLWLLQNALCTVLPSRTSEGFPLCVLESFAAGRPVLATRIPGLEELVSPGQTGWLVAPDDSSALARGISNVAADRQQALAMGCNAQRLAQRYDWRRVALRYLELFSRLLAQRVVLGRRYHGIQPTAAYA